MWPRLLLLVPLCVLASRGAADAQTNLQVWGDLSLNWIKTDRLAYALDLEPQAVAANTEQDAAGWWMFGVTPNVEFAPKKWLDLITEVGTGYTQQTDGLQSFELTPRAGLRLFSTSDNVVSFSVRRFYK